MNRILVVRYSALGDVVLATAVLRALRARHAGASIEALTDAPYAAVLAPWCDAPVWTLDRTAPRAKEIARLGGALRARRFDAVLDLQGKLTSRVLARLSGARRFGPPARAATGGDAPPVHALDRYRAAAAALVGAAPLPDPAAVTPGGLAAARAALARRLPAARGPRVVLLPGARHATKRWGAARFGALAALLVGTRGAGVLLAGGPMDAGEIAATHAAALGALARTGSVATAGAAATTAHGRISSGPVPVTAGPGTETPPWAAALLGQAVTGPDVADLLALVAGADVVVAGDTGALHLAAAAGVPTLGLFGPTDPRAWAPRGAAILWHHPSCAPCSTHGQRRCSEPRRHCLDDLPPAEALAALDKVDALLGARTGAEGDARGAP
ncbi:MAG TPA: glycosyltransferase family 9 protein [Myxococcota bacterium]|nr:glycosyltransferase family 9 protein [Myxococcota bacterium]